MKVALTVVFLFTIIPYSFSIADTQPSQPSQVNLIRGWDSADGSDYFVDADINLAGPRLSLGYGESDAVSGATVLNTTTKLIGIISNPLKDSSAGISYSEWGQDGEINIKTYRLDLVFNTDNWSFTLAPQTRVIELHTLAAKRPVIDIDSDGINLAINYYGAGPLYIGIGYSKHDYSRDVSVLDSYPILALLFSPASLQHAYGFEKERHSGNMGLLFDWGSIGIDGLRSISEVDNSVSTSISASVQYSVNKHWNLNMQSGQSDNSFSTVKTTFTSVGVGYRF